MGSVNRPIENNPMPVAYCTGAEVQKVGGTIHITLFADQPCFDRQATSIERIVVGRLAFTPECFRGLLIAAQSLREDTSTTTAKARPLTH